MMIHVYYDSDEKSDKMVLIYYAVCFIVLNASQVADLTLNQSGVKIVTVAELVSF